MVKSDGYPLHLLHDCRLRAFGGTLRHPRVWDDGGGRPLDAIDFEPRARRNDVAWPFGLDHLRPYYTRAEKVCGLGPFSAASDISVPGRLGGGPGAFADELEATVFQFSKTAFHNSWNELLPPQT